jgi:chemotaxis protein MotA
MLDNGAMPSYLDRSIFIALALSVILFLIVIITSEKALYFINPVGLMIVVLGTLIATFLHFSFQDVRDACQASRQIVLNAGQKALKRIDYLVNVSHAMKRDGILVLDREARRSAEKFLRTALEMTADGQSASEVKRFLENEIKASSDINFKAISVFETLGGYAPAMGLIGTLFGLIQMLGSLSNPEAVGPAMALALTTTLYGAILANLVFLPIAGKLKNNNNEQILIKNITLEGILSLAKRENPIVMEQKLKAFLTN